MALPVIFIISSLFMTYALSLSLSLPISHYLSHSLSLSKKSLQLQVLQQIAFSCGSKFGDYTFIL
jgi:hypothetical protein